MLVEGSRASTCPVNPFLFRAAPLNPVPAPMSNTLPSRGILTPGEFQSSLFVDNVRQISQSITCDLILLRSKWHKTIYSVSSNDINKK